MIRIAIFFMIAVIISGCTINNTKKNDNYLVADNATASEYGNKLENQEKTDADYGQNCNNDSFFSDARYPIIGFGAFNSNYEPVSASLVENNSPEQLIDQLENVLRSKGYRTTRNEVFLMLTTDPQELGYQNWRTRHEKWKIKYSLRIHLIQTKTQILYWDLAFEVVGGRSGDEDREFSPSDFRVTEEIFERINREIKNFLNRKV